MTVNVLGQFSINKLKKMIKKTWSVKTDENTVTVLPDKQVLVRMCDYGKNVLL